MATTYKVKAGDTLSQIAKQLGVGVGEISGYRSGDPNRIFAGEELTVGGSNQAQDRASAINDAFGGSSSKGSSAGSTGASTGSQKPSFRADTVYDAGSLKERAETASRNKSDALSRIEKLQTTGYDERFKAKGLDKVKDEIAILDSDIASKKQALSDSIAAARKNPGASAATITGDVGKITDKLGAEINNLIAQRNSKAADYNTGVGEINDALEREIAAIDKEYQRYGLDEANANALIAAYNQAVLSELGTDDTREYESSRDLTQFERDLQKLMVQAQNTADAQAAKDAKEEAKTADAKKAQTQNMQTAKDLVDGLITDKGLSAAVGVKGVSNLFPGTQAANFRAKVNQLKSLLTLPALSQLKGLGAMSDREFATLSASVANLDTSMSEEAFKAELKRIQKALADSLVYSESSSSGGGTTESGNSWQ